MARFSVVVMALACHTDGAIAQFPSPISQPVIANSNAATDSTDDSGPFIASAGQGLWLAFWDSTDSLGGTIGTDADILIGKSTDNGATWGTATALNSNAGSDTGSDQNPNAATDGQGTWLVVWQSTESAGGIGTDLDILLARSTDNGETWSAPIPLNNNAATDGTASDRDPQIATDGMGVWLAIWRNRDGPTSATEEDLLFSRSTDNGQNWSTPAILNLNAATDTGREFSFSVANDGQGHWVVIWYSNENVNGTIGTDSDILVTRSSDNGTTWTFPAPLNLTAATDTRSDSEPSLATDGAGLWMAVWGSTEDIGGMIGIDSDVLYAISSNNGATWSAPSPVNTTATSDTAGDGYPNLATDGNGAWMVAWESDNDLGGTIGTDTDLLVAVSTDQGGTWTTPVPLNANAATDVLAYDAGPRLATDRRGQWAAIWYSDNDFGGTVGMDYDLPVARFGIPDCNSNFIADIHDIESGGSIDCNANGVPDECEGGNDANGNGTPDCLETQIAVCCAPGSFTPIGLIAPIWLMRSKWLRRIRRYR